MDERQRILDHLDEYDEPIRDPVWKHIHLSRGLLKIIELPPFQKLGRIKQLGPAYLVYPGATHTRLAHSLGVFHVAKRMIASLVRRDGLGESGSGSEAHFTLDGVKAFLCAALLHDVGHFPFAHSLNDLRVTEHEALTADWILGELARPIRNAFGADPEMVASIVSPERASKNAESVRIYWGILSGVLDPDKLDYLNRDAYFCGVPYGIQDVDFIFQEAYPHAEKGLALSPKGITALESVLFSKYLMYKTVYWHKTVRIATAMIKKAVALGLAAGAIRREDLYGLDDEEFFAVFTEKRFPGFRLIQEVGRRGLFKQLYSVPFRDDWEVHRRLEDVDARLLLEEEIARRAGRLMGRNLPSDRIVIDVPERISFELDIPIIGIEEMGVHVPGSNLFAGKKGGDFPGSLRRISISGCREEDALAAFGKMDFSEFLAPA
jgi:HD superfamily phosphohydrolase